MPRGTSNSNYEGLLNSKVDCLTELGQIEQRI
jgi:hypothetical protein